MLFFFFNVCFIYFFIAYVFYGVWLCLALKLLLNFSYSYEWKRHHGGSDRASLRGPLMPLGALPGANRSSQMASAL